MKINGIVCLFVIACCLAIASGCHAVGTGWPTFQGNSGHTGYVPISLYAGDFSLLWQMSSDNTEFSPVTVSDGMVFLPVYVGYSGGPSFYVLDARDGHVFWSKHFGWLGPVYSAAYADGKVYLQTNSESSSTYLRTYNARTGDFVFRISYDDEWHRYCVPMVYNHSVYVSGGSSEEGMLSFDSSTGVRQWSCASMVSYQGLTAAIDDHCGYTYSGKYYSTVAGLYAVDRLTGSLAYTIADTNGASNNWSPYLSPILGEHDDALVAYGGRLICFDLQNREIAWESNRQYVGQPAVAHDTVYVIDSGALTALDEQTGNLLWSWELPSVDLCGNVVVTDSFVFASDGSTTYALDLSNHTLAWSYPAGGSLALSDGTLYITGTDYYGSTLSAISLTPSARPSPFLSGLAVDGSIWYTTDMASWNRIPGSLTTIAVGDFNGDGQYGIAGLAADQSIWYTSDRSTWTSIPGRLSSLVVGDFDGDKKDGVAGLAADGSIWYSANLNGWANIPGRLSSLVTGDFAASGQDGLTGLAADGSIWCSANLGSWTNIPGRLGALTTANMDGANKDGIAGLAADNDIWYSTDMATVSNIPGGLATMVLGDFDGDGKDDIAGLTSDGRTWYTTDEINWKNIPGRMVSLVVGNFNADPKDELAGLTADGCIWYTTDMRTWKNIPGRLASIYARGR